MMVLPSYYYKNQDGSSYYHNYRTGCSKYTPPPSPEDILFMQNRSVVGMGLIVLRNFDSSGFVKAAKAQEGPCALHKRNNNLENQWRKKTGSKKKDTQRPPINTSTDHRCIASFPL